MSVKLLNEHHVEFLSLIGDYTGSSESTRVKMPHCFVLLSDWFIVFRISFLTTHLFV